MIALVGNESADSIERISLFCVALLPLVGAFFLGLSTLFSKDERGEKFAGPLATVCAVASFVLVLMMFRNLLGEDAVARVTFSGWDWISAGLLSVPFAFSMDKLSGVMTLVVTGVGSLIHLYAIGYMSHDPNRSRFFCYLNLFLFSMLLLVLGDNLLMMFVGWEGVGLCSYLLIGFWYKEMPNAVAGQKAFVVNRIGDLGFLLGMFVLFWQAGTLSFSELQGGLQGVDTFYLELAAALLFVGAIGKSAQIPLFVWLPDAMAGPTPVSALIHAATMVTAGIYMITRLSYLYVSAPMTMTAICVVGTMTAFLAATIAVTQNDIKKVLAYSTVSQLGYMFMALGAASFSSAIFHVVTHAFFKACLFMGAGSVIHGCHHEQDMRMYGGLWKKMKWTFATYFVATWAISGVPIASGFYSKDQILWSVFSSENLPTIGGTPLGHILWAFGLLTAFLTAFYMTRSLMLTFFTGKYRGHGTPHESPWTMVLPISVLAIPSLLFGFLYGEHLVHFLDQWTRADIAVGHEELARNPAYHALEIVSIVVALAGVSVGVLYGQFRGASRAIVRTFPKLYNFILNKWWIDELYDALIVAPLRGLSQFAFKIGDRGIIDSSVNGVGLLVGSSGELLRRAHFGTISSNLVVMIVGVVCGVFYWLLF